MADARSAQQTAALWTSLVRAYARSGWSRSWGCPRCCRGLEIAAEGKRIHARLHIPAERRAELGEKLLALLQMLAAARARAIAMSGAILGLSSDDETTIPTADIGTSFPTFAETLSAVG